MKNYILSMLLLSLLLIACSKTTASSEINDTTGNLPDVSGYPIVGTNQTIYYDDQNEITAPYIEQAFYGQNADYLGTEPSYTDNGDGTVTDNVTGLMWAQSPDMDGDGDIDVTDKMTYDEALAGAETFNLAGYDDWRLPSIKEQYSLIIFSGVDPSGYEGTSTDDLVPFIDDNYFDFSYGDTMTSLLKCFRMQRGTDFGDSADAMTQQE